MQTSLFRHDSVLCRGDGQQNNTATHRYRGIAMCCGRSLWNIARPHLTSAATRDGAPTQRDVRTADHTQRRWRISSRAAAVTPDKRRYPSG